MSGASAPKSTVTEELEAGLQARLGVGIKDYPSKRDQVSLQALKKLVAKPSLDPQERAEYQRAIGFLENVDQLGSAELDELQAIVRRMQVRLLSRPKRKKKKVHPSPASSAIAPAPPLVVKVPSAASGSAVGIQGVPTEIQTELEQLFVDWEYATATYDSMSQLPLERVVEIIEAYEKVAERIREMLGKLGSLSDDSLQIRLLKYSLFQGIENIERLKREKSPKAQLYHIADRIEELLEEEWPLPKEELVAFEENEFKDLNQFLSGSSDEEHYHALSALIGDIKFIIRCYKAAAAADDFIPEMVDFYQNFACLHLYRLHYTYGRTYGEVITDEIRQELEELEKEIEQEEDTFEEYLKS